MSTKVGVAARTITWENFMIASGEIEVEVAGSEDLQGCSWRSLR